MWTEKHFELTEDEMEDIRRKREMKRSRKKFSEMLSSEGQAAMKLAREDTFAMIQKPSGQHQGALEGEKTKGGRQSDRQQHRQKKTISFSDAYKKTSGFLMEGDITHAESRFADPQKPVLGGVKLETALDVVENIDSENDTNGAVDEVAIEETAKRNSVQKCLVWMEVTENDTVSNNGSKVVQA